MVTKPSYFYLQEMVHVEKGLIRIADHPGAIRIAYVFEGIKAFSVPVAVEGSPHDAQKPVKLCVPGDGSEKKPLSPPAADAHRGEKAAAMTSRETGKKAMRFTRILLYCTMTSPVRG